MPTQAVAEKPAAQVASPPGSAATKQAPDSTPANAAAATVLPAHLRHDGLGRSLRAAVQRRAAPEQLLQREVRIDGGKKRVKEHRYQPGGMREHWGSRFKVADLLTDPVKRVFESEGELVLYAEGMTDYIGDVVTQTAGTFWYRLPEHDLTVLGERHSNPEGHVDDVLKAFGTARFMQEPFNAATPLAAAPDVDFADTNKRLGEVNAGLATGLTLDPAFDPSLENIVIKALTGASIFRNEFLAAKPKTMKPAVQDTWKARPTVADWSYGERCALYLSMALHLTEDIARKDYGAPKKDDTQLVRSSRALKAFFDKNELELRSVMEAKDKDDLIGIYELTEPDGFKILPVLKQFTLLFHEYAAQYVRQLGKESGNKKLESEGSWLSKHREATLGQLSPAREEIMWERVKLADSSGYLIVGMGDAHRRDLEARLNAEGIAHARVDEHLKKQEAQIAATWVP
jgi:hypothetical protein